MYKVDMCSHVILSLDIIANEDRDSCCDDEYILKFGNGEDCYNYGAYNPKSRMNFLLTLINRKFKSINRDTIDTFIGLSFESKYYRFYDAMHDLLSYPVHTIGNFLVKDNSIEIVNSLNPDDIYVVPNMTMSQFEVYVTNKLQCSINNLIDWEFESEYPEFKEAVKDMLKF